MKYPTLILIAFMLAGCANVTALYDEATGTTLEQRCASRRAGVAMYDSLGRALSENEARVRADYQIFIDGVCGLPAAP